MSSARFSAPLCALALAALSLDPAAAHASPAAPMHGAHSVPAPGGANGAPPAEVAPAVLSAPKLPATSGPRALLGIAWIRAAALGARLDVGWQLPLTNVVALRGHLSSLYSYDSVSLPDVGGLLPSGELEIHELALLATAEIDAAIFSTEQGRLGAGGGLGIGPSLAWVRMPDMPFQPGEWTHASAVIGRLSGHLEYRFASGWVLRGQPVGLLFSGQDNADTVYEMAVMGGYQW
ncbi:hypothetical protein WMF30_20795 [Sorangium sp. So ce134]